MKSPHISREQSPREMGAQLATEPHHPSGFDDMGTVNYAYHFWIRRREMSYGVFVGCQNENNGMEFLLGRAKRGISRLLTSGTR